MALSKSFRLFHKLDPPYSVILEERNIDESLLFESGVVGVLSPTEVETLKKSCNYVRLDFSWLQTGAISAGLADPRIHDRAVLSIAG